MYVTLNSITYKTFETIAAWTADELKALKREFRSEMNKGVYPSGSQINAFLSKSGIKRSVAVVKAKLQHLMKK